MGSIFHDFRLKECFLIFHDFHFPHLTPFPPPFFSQEGLTTIFVSILPSPTTHQMPPRKPPKQQGEPPPSKKRTPNLPTGHPNRTGEESPGGTKEGSSPNHHTGEETPGGTKEGSSPNLGSKRNAVLGRLLKNVRPLGKGKRLPWKREIGFNDEDREPSYRPPSSNLNTPPPRPRSTRTSPRKTDAMGYIDPDNIDVDVNDNDTGLYLDDDDSSFNDNQKKPASNTYAISAMEQKSPIELVKKYMKKIAAKAVDDRLAMAGVLASLGSSSNQQESSSHSSRNSASDHNDHHQEANDRDEDSDHDRVDGIDIVSKSLTSISPQRTLPDDGDAPKNVNDEDGNEVDARAADVGGRGVAAAARALDYKDDQGGGDNDAEAPFHKDNDVDGGQDNVRDLLGDFLEHNVGDYLEDYEGVGDDDIVAERNVDDYTECGLVKSTIDYDDDSAFEDDEVPQDMNYYRDTNGRPGRSLIDGGPQRPCTDGMTKASTDHAMKAWRKEHKKWTDALSFQKNKRRRSMPVLGEESDSDDSLN